MPFMAQQTLKQRPAVYTTIRDGIRVFDFMLFEHLNLRQLLSFDQHTMRHFVRTCTAQYFMVNEYCARPQ